MSHMTTVKIEVKDISALRMACRDLGFTLEEKVAARAFTHQPVSDYVVKLPGAYDIALNANKTGGFMLSADYYLGHIERYAGAKCGKLLQHYALAVTRKQFVGKSMRLSTMPDGSIKINVQI